MVHRSSRRMCIRNVRLGASHQMQSFVIHVAIRLAIRPAKYTLHRLSPCHSSVYVCVSFSSFSINPRYNSGFTVMRVLAREGRCNRLLSRATRIRGIFLRGCKNVVAGGGVEEELRGSFTICIKVDRSTKTRAFVSRNGTKRPLCGLYFRHVIRPLYAAIVWDYDPVSKGIIKRNSTYMISYHVLQLKYKGQRKK